MELNCEPPLEDTQKTRKTYTESKRRKMNASIFIFSASLIPSVNLLPTNNAVETATLLRTLFVGAKKRKNLFMNSLKLELYQ